MTVSQPVATIVRIYIGAKPVDARFGATPIEALAAHDPAAAALVRDGSRVIVDNRGLPAPQAEPVTNGSIFRVVSSKQS